VETEEVGSVVEEGEPVNVAESLGATVSGVTEGALESDEVMVVAGLTVSEATALVEAAVSAGSVDDGTATSTLSGGAEGTGDTSEAVDEEEPDGVPTEEEYIVAVTVVVMVSVIVAELGESATSCALTGHSSGTQTRVTFVGGVSRAQTRPLSSALALVPLAELLLQMGWMAPVSELYVKFWLAFDPQLSGAPHGHILRGSGIRGCWLYVAQWGIVLFWTKMAF